MAVVTVRSEVKPDPVNVQSFAGKTSVQSTTVVTRTTESCVPLRQTKQVTL